MLRAGGGARIGRVVAQELKLRGCLSLMLWILEENQPGDSANRSDAGLSVNKGTQGAVEVAYGWAAIEDLWE